MSTVRTFGHAIVVQLDEQLASRLLSAQTYEAARVPGGSSPLDLISIGTSDAPAYVLAGPPRVLADDAAIELQRPSVAVPFIEYSAPPPLPIEVRLANVAVAQAQQDLHYDLAGVTDAHVGLWAIELSPAADGSGAGVTALDVEDPDAQRRKQIAAAVQDVEGAVPFAPPTLDGIVRPWTLRPFRASSADAGGNRITGGISLGLWDGAHPPTQPLSSAILDAGAGEPYSVGIAIAAATLAPLVTQLLADALTPSASPWVTMLSQPLFPGVHLDAPNADGLAAVRCDLGDGSADRALTVVHASATHRATLDADGRAVVHFAAAIGDPVTVSLDGFVKKFAATTVTFRPGAPATCADGGLECELIGLVEQPAVNEQIRARILLPMVADRGQAMGLAFGTPELREVHASHGLEAILWFTGDAFYSTLGAGLLAGLYSRILTPMINRFADLGAVVSGFGLAPSLPSIPGAAVFLDEVLVTRDGMALAGRADAGMVRLAGRTQVALADVSSYVFAGNGVYHVADWSTAHDGAVELRLRGHGQVLGADAATFWRATYDHAVQAHYADAVTRLQPGDATTLVVAGPSDLMKVLVERGAGDDAATLTLTWIAWQARVAREVRLEVDAHHAVASTGHFAGMDARELRHEGRVWPVAQRFFLGATPRQERWRWDGIELTHGVDQGIPGGWVRLDAVTRQLRYRIDTTAADPGSLPVAHRVEFSGRDLLERDFAASLVVLTPPILLTPVRGDLGVPPPLRDPLRDPIRSPIRARNPLERRRLIRARGDALATHLRRRLAEGAAAPEVDELAAELVRLTRALR
ncbi:MAG: hypothetical protein JNK64_09435 [Myxococcales bacterium]|nr:hypothetical protein [Myxococcales bacterium]